MKTIVDMLPPHEASLTLTHNEHKDMYQPVEEWISEHEDNNTFDWVSVESRRLAIETNSVWVLHWYPTSPVGFCAFAAHDLNLLLERVNS